MSSLLCLARRRLSVYGSLHASRGVTQGGSQDMCRIIHSKLRLSFFQCMDVVGICAPHAPISCRRSPLPFTRSWSSALVNAEALERLCTRAPFCCAISPRVMLKAAQSTLCPLMELCMWPVKKRKTCCVQSRELKSLRKRGCRKSPVPIGKLKGKAFAKRPSSLHAVGSCWMVGQGCITSLARDFILSITFSAAPFRTVAEPLQVLT